MDRRPPLSVASGLGAALKIFTQRAAELGFITEAEVASAAQADGVDWGAVSVVAERTMAIGFLGL